MSADVTTTNMAASRAIHELQLLVSPEEEVDRRQALPEPLVVHLADGQPVMARPADGSARLSRPTAGLVSPRGGEGPVLHIVRHPECRWGAVLHELRNADRLVILRRNRSG